MSLTMNNHGGVDLLATCTDLDKRLTAIELKVSPPVASKAAPKHDWGTIGTTAGNAAPPIFIGLNRQRTAPADGSGQQISK